MIDLTIREMGNLQIGSRKDLVDFLMRTDEDQQWTTASTFNNIYVIPGGKYMHLPDIEDRKVYRRELLSKLKDIPSPRLTCTEFEIMIWQMDKGTDLKDVLKTATDELKDEYNDHKFYSKSLCFILHTEDNIPLQLYRLFDDTGERYARVRDPLEYLTEEELKTLSSLPPITKELEENEEEVEKEKEVETELEL